MKEQINKTFEYKITIGDTMHTVHVSATGMDKNIKIKNIHTGDYPNSIFSVSVKVSPDLPKEEFDGDVDLVFMLGNRENDKVGYIKDEHFVELNTTLFLDELRMRLLHALSLTGNSGLYKFDF